MSQYSWADLTRSSQAQFSSSQQSPRQEYFTSAQAQLLQQQYQQQRSVAVEEWARFIQRVMVPRKWPKLLDLPSGA